jgi:hypothetical protein
MPLARSRIRPDWRGVTGQGLAALREEWTRRAELIHAEASGIEAEIGGQEIMQTTLMKLSAGMYRLGAELIRTAERVARKIRNVQP